MLLGLTLLASPLIRRVTAMPGFPLVSVAEGVSVRGWVGLWQPVDVLPHEWHSYRRSNRIYRRILDMEITVWPERGEGQTADG